MTARRSDPAPQPEPPIYHGGDIDAARERHGEVAGGWIDLSTGINPLAYPVGALPQESWAVLPCRRASDGLLQAARGFYRVNDYTGIAAAPGTQALIQWLPVILPARRVAVLAPTYEEHGEAWRRAGAEVLPVSGLDEARQADVVVIVNPNNPDGRIIDPADILSFSRHLQARGGLVIVDEAFAEVAPQASVVPHLGDDVVLVLRSFGKFFGLAGVRLGFAIGPDMLVRRMSAALGPWAVAGPAIEIGTQALDDADWIGSMRDWLALARERLDRMLTTAGLEILGGTDLYRLTRHDDAAGLHDALAAHGIWTRPFPARPHWLRFGLPATAGQEERLRAALQSWRRRD